jgi:hypothetical protein
MKRRIIKKEIRGLANELVVPSRKYAVASPKVHKDMIYGYEREIEGCIFRLMRLYLLLDRSWPSETRWLDDFEDFRWEKKGSVIHGRAGLWWGRWPEVSESMTCTPLSAEIRPCERHGVEYRLRFGDAPEIRGFSSRKWCGAG